LEDIKRMNAAMYRYDGLCGGDVRHPADRYVGALVSMDRSSEAASKPSAEPAAGTITVDGDVNDA
jgi:hypothetical protein